MARQLSRLLQPTGFPGTHWQVLIIDRRTHQIVTIVPSGNTGSQPSAPGDYWRR